jgi:probable addiction module antidote protein
MAAIPEEAGLNRTSLYRAFEDDGNPLFFNVLKVLSSLGLSLQVVPATTTTHRIGITRE